MENESSPHSAVRIYTPSRKETSLETGSGDSSVPLPAAKPEVGPGNQGKRKLVAKGFQKTISKTSLLANFLPTGTLLTFEMLLPSASGKGQCNAGNALMINALLALCSLSCFLFHFTDSFKTPDGKVYYGFVTPKGLSMFKTGPGVEVPQDKKYKLGLSDMVHAVMSVMVFMAIALSDHRVTNCLFPGKEKEMDEVMESFPLMVGVVCSALFLVFPNTRYGVGCMPS
ncbi:hypothetical protein MLD38_011598 [Melastoma candidum]|uniref:Uncharacterized protein n=1 Tax=Melastoma candidum TaxID=119954 RepID=A0ACB9R6L1_9MYRT|nr:hypothetical protein MLD38_011598 [Melastoma candidum]